MSLKDVIHIRTHFMFFIHSRALPGTLSNVRRARPVRFATVRDNATYCCIHHTLRKVCLKVTVRVTDQSAALSAEFILLAQIGDDPRWVR